MIKFVCLYWEEYDRQKGEKRSKIFEAPKGSTWRFLQNKFDPNYRYDNLEFFELGIKIELVQ